jgi:hypothetical protein
MRGAGSSPPSPELPLPKYPAFEADARTASAEEDDICRGAKEEVVVVVWGSAAVEGEVGW